LNRIREYFKNPQNPAERVFAQGDEIKRLQKELEEYKVKEISALQKELRSEFVNHNDIQLLVKRLPISDANAVKTLAYNLEKEVGNAVIVFGTAFNDKPQLTIRISDELIQSKGLNAGNLIRALAKDISGGGGGQAFFATAGGSEVSGLDAALARVKTLV
jgi:alanyl-tRNA synthetase